MTPDRHLAERYGDPVRNETVPLEEWTADEQRRHRVTLVGDAHNAAFEASRRKAPKRSRPGRARRLPPDTPGMPSPANAEAPHARKAKGQTLEELLGEW